MTAYSSACALGAIFGPTKTPVTVTVQSVTAVERLITIITAVFSISLYLADKGERTALYKINKNVYIKTSKIIII